MIAKVLPAPPRALEMVLTISSVPSCLLPVHGLSASAEVLRALPDVGSKTTSFSSAFDEIWSRF